MKAKIEAALASLASGCATPQELGEKLAAQGIHESFSTKYTCGCPIAVYLAKEIGEEVVTVGTWSMTRAAHEKNDPAWEFGATHPKVVEEFVYDYDKGRWHWEIRAEPDPYAALRITEEERQIRIREYDNK